MDLNTLVIAVKNCISNNGFNIKVPKYEQQNENVYVNVQTICMGAYFGNATIDITLWVGYWERHGFCISFFSKTKAIDAILKKYCFDFSSDYNFFDKGYWFSINLSWLFDNEEKISKYLEVKKGDDTGSNVEFDSESENCLVNILSKILKLKEEITKNTISNWYWSKHEFY